MMHYSKRSDDNRVDTRKVDLSISLSQTETLEAQPSITKEIVGKQFYLSLLPGGENDQISSPTHGVDLNWYGTWLNRQLSNVPHTITQNIRSFPGMFEEVAKLAKYGCNIENLAAEILEFHLTEDTSPGNINNQAARTLAFALLGWQTMLYEPAFQTCPLQQFAITDVLDGHNSQAFMTLKQDQSRISSCLPAFLLGFGLMLPKKNLCISEDDEDCQAFEKMDVVNPGEFNAELLHSLARINIKWIDVMSPHLEFDKGTNTLFLYRYPSFCRANIQTQEGGKSVIHGCANDSDCNDDNWASEMEVTQTLQEIILSYRLLFGQSKASRRLFQSMNIFEGESPNAHDPLLGKLCGSKSFELPMIFKDREFYRLRRDFPILRSRIASLQQQLLEVKPGGWMGIWKDKRNTAQWYTFWAVMVFGGCGVILAILQVALQAAQLSIS